METAKSKSPLCTTVRGKVGTHLKKKDVGSVLLHTVLLQTHSGCPDKMGLALCGARNHQPVMHGMDVVKEKGKLSQTPDLHTLLTCLETSY